MFATIRTGREILCLPYARFEEEKLVVIYIYLYHVWQSCSNITRGQGGGWLGERCRKEENIFLQNQMEHKNCPGKIFKTFIIVFFSCLCFLSREHRGQLWGYGTISVWNWTCFFSGSTSLDECTVVELDGVAPLVLDPSRCKFTNRQIHQFIKIVVFLEPRMRCCTALYCTSQ